MGRARRLGESSYPAHWFRVFGFRVLGLRVFSSSPLSGAGPRAGRPPGRAWAGPRRLRLPCPLSAVDVVVTTNLSLVTIIVISSMYTAICYYYYHHY